VERLDSIWAFFATHAKCLLVAFPSGKQQPPPKRKLEKWLERIQLSLAQFRIIQATLIQQTDKQIRSTKKQLRVAQEVVPFALSSFDHLGR